MVVAAFNPLDNDKSTSKNGVQFMITKKMRNTLIDDLGYLSDEVNEMEPQVRLLYTVRHIYHTQVKRTILYRLQR